MQLNNLLTRAVPRVAVHSGDFHADEATGAAVVALAYGADDIRVVEDWLEQPRKGVLDVVRTREPAVVARADIALDVGMQYDPQTGRLDHHQKGGAGERPNRVPYASAGLAWKHFGAQAILRLMPALTQDQVLCVHERIDREFMQPIDSCDNGIGMGGPSGVQLPALVGMLNPTWMDKEVPEAAARAFERAASFVKTSLLGAIASACAQELAVDEVLQAIEREEGGIIILPRDLPWQLAVCEHSESARFVVHPASSGRFNVYAVPARPLSFQRRALFPASWAGLEYEDLARVTGVEDAVFCHCKRFISVAQSLEGAKRLAVLAF